MITPLSWLERVPTYKDQQEQLKEKDLATYGFLGYPLLQSADILLYQPKYVPVGKDQEAHVEITREVARRFNSLYPGRFYFDSTAALGAEAVKTKARKIAGQPAKEHFTTHELRAGRPSIEAQVTLVRRDHPSRTRSPAHPIAQAPRHRWPQDVQELQQHHPALRPRARHSRQTQDHGHRPARIRRTDPGNPDVCPVFDIHKVFSTEETQQNVRDGCTTAGIGCIECKGWLADAVVGTLAPIQQRRRHFEANPTLVTDILADGATRAAARARITMEQVREVVGLS